MGDLWNAMSSSEVVAFIDKYEDDSDKDMVPAVTSAQKIMYNISYKIRFSMY